MCFEIISVVGLGYIGLPTAAMLSFKEKTVIGVDVNKHAVDTINKGCIHIVEPGLSEVVRQVVGKGFLKATTVPEPADAFLIAVPTPFVGEFQPDVSYIKSACSSIAPCLKKGDLIILESTSPVGTTELMAEWLQEARPDLKFPFNENDIPDVHLAYCPERVLPGQVLRELVENDRVVGGVTPECSRRAKELYNIFVEGECVVTNSRTAEMAKLTENSFRDVNIAFANELSIICDKENIDVWELIALANRHPRVNILKPGAGVGGHCIAVDPWFIVAKSPDEAKLIKTAREVNDSKPLWLIEKVKVAIADCLLENPNKSVNDIVIGCYGLAFKPDIDDLRESPAVKIVNMLAESFAGRIVVCEPHINSLPDSMNSKLELLEITKMQPVTEIDVILVAHSAFSGLFEDSSKSIIDACGVVKQVSSSNNIRKIA
ncbi:UDP-N-acetyl-D-mannosamine dehydrogenase [Halodesulfovibrio aestuarii]|uniref:UDP-N-acetyl-D-mannosamine dehydrogenase n=1 Tax=Halodesulfovibrio aestuarii TaxID=126333 RepID=A0ABV4JU02_9BACT